MEKRKQDVVPEELYNTLIEFQWERNFYNELNNRTKLTKEDKETKKNTYRNLQKLQKELRQLFNKWEDLRDE